MSERERFIIDVIHRLNRMFEFELPIGEMVLLWRAIQKNFQGFSSYLEEIESVVRASSLNEEKKCRILEILQGVIESTR